MYAILRVPHRVSCACHAMPCVPSTLPRTTFAIAAPADAQKHETTLILLDQKSIKDIRFTVSKEFWRGYPFYNTLPARVMGTFEQWGLTSKLIPYITWDDGQRDTALSMCDLLAADFQFELYADGRSKPKANARRLLAGGAGIGTAAAEDDEAVADGDQPSTISVPYQVGRAEHMPPPHITTHIHRWSMRRRRMRIPPCQSRMLPVGWAETARSVATVVMHVPRAAPSALTPTLLWWCASQRSATRARQSVARASQSTGAAQRHLNARRRRRHGRARQNSATRHVHSGSSAPIQLWGIHVPPCVTSWHM